MAELPREIRLDADTRDHGEHEIHLTLDDHALPMEIVENAYSVDLVISTLLERLGYERLPQQWVPSAITTIFRLKGGE